MLIYTAGKYSGTPEEVKENIAVAAAYAKQLILMGHSVICPHLNSTHKVFKKDLTWEDFLRIDLEIIKHCDTVFMMPGWKESPGAKCEYAYAKKIGKNIYTDISLIPDGEPDEYLAFVNIKKRYNW